MFPGGGYGRGGQYFGPAYDLYGEGGSRGGGWGRGRRQRRRRGHGAGWQGGRGGFPAAHLGQNHGQGYGQEDYEEEDYGQEGYDGNQNGGQDLREQLRQRDEALRSKEEEVRSLRRALAEKNEAFQSKVEELESVRGTLAEMNEANKRLEKEKDQVIAQKNGKIRSAEAQRESAIQARSDLRSKAVRIIKDLQGKEAEAKKDAAQARTELQSANEVVAEQTAQIEALQNMLKDHEDGMHRSSTQGAATVPGPEVELLTEASEYTQAHDTITRWKEWFQFVEDDEFHDARTMADLVAILAEAQPRGRLYEFLTVGPLDEWLCLSRVCENKFAITANLCCRAPGGYGVACRAVMVTIIDSMQLVDALERVWHGRAKMMKQSIIGTLSLARDAWKGGCRSMVGVSFSGIKPMPEKESQPRRSTRVWRGTKRRTEGKFSVKTTADRAA
ncbi:uncharacterized protein NECHADRAFT_85139 [Fusarium vanettenii 77-13-4]|uniref:Uncharacterized protein n=1 Tax=Fusarium vanettenii (strain ATCC MYA-4622 / CBS 123669 / FGSC 9596 / NRRL 45880 / 77-13-4) TaxID=660122 RepID=C7YV37_FUSV7|nr:uncharacterized protein NECHADRAFT_85139 [Fusarium vanettenii 77-13-4]EEU44917.1 hypothetical protein NECHADRAFT_85139 [Fusarium vanettenii 77-13-4]